MQDLEIVYRVGRQDGKVHRPQIQRPLLVEVGQQQQVVDEFAHTGGFRCAVMNASSSADCTCSGGLPTTVKKALRSDTAASTVSGRHRPAKNSRYPSASGTERARREPAACAAASDRHRRPNPSRLAEMTRTITGITYM